MRGLSLDWKHCPDGVEVIVFNSHEERTKLQPLKSGLPGHYVEVPYRTALLTGGYEPGKIVFRARTRHRYPKRLEVTDLEDPVVVRFVNARDNQARAQFLGQFGFLFPEPDHREYWINDMTTHQREMRKLLASAGSDQPDIAGLNKLLRYKQHLVPVLDGRRLSFSLETLYGLMLREVVMVVEKDARLTTCQHCDEAFLTGPTTGRRSHATYCSDRCRVAAMRARNAG